MDRAKDLLEALLADFEHNKKNTYTSLFRSWQKIAGENLSAHSRIIDFKKGILFIESDHPGWHQMLELEKSSIKKKLKKMYPELPINDIHTTISYKEKKTEKVVNDVNKINNKDNNIIIFKEFTKRQNTNISIDEKEDFLLLLKRIGKLINQRNKT